MLPPHIHNASRRLHSKVVYLYDIGYICACDYCCCRCKCAVNYVRCVRTCCVYCPTSSSDEMSRSFFPTKRCRVYIMLMTLAPRIINYASDAAVLFLLWRDYITRNSIFNVCASRGGLSAARS
jgi:hypothetical protein